jgi:transcriptional regulator with XRE-family HTH domain
MSRPPIRKPPRCPLTVHRLRQGLTLQALSDRCGISVPFLGALEVGTRNASPAVWQQIAKALGVHVSQIRPGHEKEAAQGALFDADAFVEIVGDLHDPA